MTTLLDRNRAALSKVPGSDEETPFDRVLSDINALAPMIARLGPEIEQGRRLLKELVCVLKSARLFGMVVPRRFGGLGLAAPSALRAVTALARLDGSVGWNVMNGHLACLLPFLGSEPLCEKIFHDGKDHIIAASGQPAGRAERAPGGWRVTGYWPFASGCQDAEWIGAACVMMDDGSPIADPQVPGPLVRYCLMPASAWEILDTWHAFGLKGTGSHHVALKNVLALDSDFIEFPFGESFAQERIFSRLPEIVVLSHGAFAVGVAEAAIADLVEVAKSGVKQMFMTTPLVETDRFKENLGRFDAKLKAARALLETEVARVWDNPEPVTGKSFHRVVEQVQTVVWITAACVDVAAGCVELAGSRAVYESSSLQRRLRDLQAAATHIAVHPRHYAVAGEAMLARSS